ncbi:GNAT family N-acetyltransferase [Stakelama saccharophila]|uniref:GNAT family N-acetyltransferase n=1 Tax=Stakelama saccharophila TaxID=3075605 RepID=A0ABZ0BBT9_9SPHN|nr:GNAT family N-acetyltransferase [Stakelama sp. W311]WNO54753.1 GNAT family N-acetyltransferase [Stakelama sp. W311]
MNDTPVIETARLRLRRLVADDAEALYPGLSDPETMTWWSRAPLESPESTRDYLATRQKDGWRAWAITRNDDDHALGWVSVGEKRQGGVSEIGYFLIRAAWGSGRAREAVAGVLDQLFRVEEKRRVFADTDPDNAASRGLLERLGFTPEGNLRGEWETHIGVRDSVIYGLLREEWLGERA